MSYRKITVDGKQYEYIVGKTHLKIKGFDVFRISDVGNHIAGTLKYVVTPAVIAAIIRKDDVPISFHCAKHDYRTTELTYAHVDPTYIGKKAHVIDCPECRSEAVYGILGDYPEDRSQQLPTA
jgi:hypothetical protein